MSSSFQVLQRQWHPLIPLPVSLVAGQTRGPGALELRASCSADTPKVHGQEIWATVPSIASFTYLFLQPDKEALKIEENDVNNNKKNFSGTKFIFVDTSSSLVLKNVCGKRLFPK